MRKILQCVPMNEVRKTPEDFLGHSYVYGLVGPAALGQVAAAKGKRSGGSQGFQAATAALWGVQAGPGL